MGTIYQRGEVFWIKYYRHGKPYRESAKSTKEGDAKRLLKKREGEISEGKLPGVYFDKIRFEELAEDFLRDRRINQRSEGDAQKRLNNLNPFFEAMRVTDITTSRINAYVDKRLSEGAANGTVNRELAALKRMLKLGARHEPPKVARVPHIEMLKEAEPRQGFFEDIEFEAFRAALPSELHGFVTFGYLTGWRFQEVAGLAWDRVDMNNRTVRLNAQDTKNEEQRLLKMEPALFEVVEACLNEKKAGCPYVFHRNGQRVKDIRGIWNKACRETGLGYGYRLNNRYAKKWEEKGLPGGPIFHDFRRTAVRNMNRAGIQRKVAMLISGHKTESIFERYNIANDKDLEEAALKMEAFRNRGEEAKNQKEQEALFLFYLLSNLGRGHKMGTIGEVSR